MKWKTRTLEDGRECHKAAGPKWQATIYDWKGTRPISWHIYNETADRELMSDIAESVEKAKGKVSEYLRLKELH
jgi:hypothetical protein